LSHWGIERASVNAAAWPADEPAVSELLSALLQQTTAPKQWLVFLKPQSELYSSFFRLFTMVSALTRQSELSPINLRLVYSAGGQSAAAFMKL